MANTSLLIIQGNVLQVKKKRLDSEERRNVEVTSKNEYNVSHSAKTPK